MHALFFVKLEAGLVYLPFILGGAPPTHASSESGGFSRAPPPALGGVRLGLDDLL